MLKTSKILTLTFQVQGLKLTTLMNENIQNQILDVKLMMYIHQQNGIQDRNN
ncbi:unnamed protein product [Paramecium sonneborni]|uniref:Uncharacterized protein n=1 Tax=Paramecium sonneborni TaxID=65129 RepID=A0A8S1RGR1_9CILI|nr:unnamed protein product [Paramecium sonneborni]